MSLINKKRVIKPSKVKPLESRLDIKEKVKKTSKPINVVSNDILDFHIEIEKDIPIPNYNESGASVKIRSLLNKLLVGESFLLPGNFANSTNMASIHRFNKLESAYESGKRVITRLVDGGRRVWRVK